MIPPIFEVCRMSRDVQMLLGGQLPRLYPFGEAPQDVPKPYATYQLISGAPDNTLTVPESDHFSLQVDVFGRSQTETLNVFGALRDAVQQKGYVTGYNINGREEDTKLWRLSFDVDWIVDR